MLIDAPQSPFSNADSFSASHVRSPSASYLSKDESLDVVVIMEDEPESPEPSVVLPHRPRVAPNPVHSVAPNPVRSIAPNPVRSIAQPPARSVESIPARSHAQFSAPPKPIQIPGRVDRPRMPPQRPRHVSQLIDSRNISDQRPAPLDRTPKRLVRKWPPVKT